MKLPSASSGHLIKKRCMRKHKESGLERREVDIAIVNKGGCLENIRRRGSRERIGKKGRGLR